MASKWCFGPEENQYGRVVDPGVLNKTIIIVLLGVARNEMIITNSTLRISLVIYHFISSAPS